MNRVNPLVLMATALGNMLGQRHAQQNQKAARRAKSILSGHAMAGIMGAPPPSNASYTTTAQPGWRAEARRRKYRKLEQRRRRNRG